MSALLLKAEGRSTERERGEPPPPAWVSSNCLNDPLEVMKVYEFPMAAVTNYHQLDGLKQHTFILLQF